MGGVAVGDPFPSIELQGSAGEAVRLGERTAGQPAVVYFYPKDATPGCTREARDFQRLWPRFRAAGIAVVGVSVDGPAAHRAFAADCGLEFPLLSDPGGALARALGILDPERGVARRTTYLLDAQGRIRRIWPNVRVDGHADEVLAAAAGPGDGG